MMDDPVFLYTLRILRDEERKQKKVEENPKKTKKGASTSRPLLVNLTAQQKYEALQLLLTENKSIKSIMRKYKCGGTQIYGILKNKVEITDRYLKGGGDQKKPRLTKNAQVNEVTYKWFRGRQQEGLPVSGPRLQQVALQAAKSLHMEDFKASTGWLRSFRRNYSIDFKSRTSQCVNSPAGESEEMTQEVMDIVEGLSCDLDGDTT